MRLLRDRGEGFFQKWKGKEMTEKERKEKILAELERTWPEARAELHFTNPYETLVATILSAQCTDRQVNLVTPAVFARYPDALAMAEAEEADLSSASDGI